MYLPRRHQFVWSTGGKSTQCNSRQIISDRLLITRAAVAFRFRQIIVAVMIFVLFFKTHLTTVWPREGHSSETKILSRRLPRSSILGLWITTTQYRTSRFRSLFFRLFVACKFGFSAMVFPFRINRMVLLHILVCRYCGNSFTLCWQPPAVCLFVQFCEKPFGACRKTGSLIIILPAYYSEKNTLFSLKGYSICRRRKYKALQLDTLSSLPLI